MPMVRPLFLWVCFFPRSDNGLSVGCNEIIFNPLVTWWRKGPISQQLRGFVWSSAPLHYKIGMMSYMFSYCKSSPHFFFTGSFSGAPPNLLPAARSMIVPQVPFGSLFNISLFRGLISATLTPLICLPRFYLCVCHFGMLIHPIFGSSPSLPP